MSVGYGGISIPGALSNITVSDTTLGGGVTNARINDLALESRAETRLPAAHRGDCGLIEM